MRRGGGLLRGGPDGLVWVLWSVGLALQLLLQPSAAQKLDESDPVVTTVEPLGPVHEAEDVHQDFYGRQPFNGYCQVIINPKLAAVRRRYAAWLTD